MKTNITDQFKDFLDSTKDDFEEAAKLEKGARTQLPPIGTKGEAALMSIRAGTAKETGNPYIMFNFVVQEPEEFKGADSVTIFTLADNSMFTKLQAIAMMYDALETWGLPRDLRESGDLRSCLEWFEEGLMVDFVVSADSNKRNEQGRKLVCTAQQGPAKKAETTKGVVAEKASEKPTINKPAASGFTEGQEIEYDKKTYTFVRFEGDNVVLRSKMGRERNVPVTELE